MLVTVGIPTLNRLGYLQEAVASALAQTHTELEVIVSDDGVSAELASWARSAQAKDGRLRYQRTGGQVGLAGNWNAIAQVSAGEYTVIIGDDDRLLPDFVETLLRVGGDSDVTFSNHFWIDETGARLAEVTRKATVGYGRHALLSGPIADPESVVWQNAVPMSASIIRTSHLRRLRFREDLNSPELDFFARLAHAGGRFTFTSDFLAEYRVHAQQETARGLTLDRLAGHLASIPVSAKATATKRALIEFLMLSAVTAAIERGDLRFARELGRSELYPKWSSRDPRLLAQFLCARLPKGIGSKIYRLLVSANRLRRSR